jgi:hypothetical protein
MSGDIASELVGTWRLISYTGVTSGGETIYPMGRNAQGRLTYEAGGRMAVQLADPDRAAFAAGAHAYTDAEVRAAFEGYFAYYGAYSVHADRGIVVHHLEMCLTPNWIGGDQVRYFDLQAGRLALKTPPIPMFSGAEAVLSLIWEKLTM